jgi:hypothetical protein
MWSFKKKNKVIQGDDEIKWYPVGSENPFDAPILDIRFYTLNMIASTKDYNVAENYSLSRESDGSQFISKEPDHPISYPINISYPHNNEKLEGIVFKSPAMEVKWDIYAYGEWFYFVRSWSSKLIFKAKYLNNGNTIQITEIMAPKEFSQKESENIHSIMLTHVFSKVWPYYISERLHQADDSEIALYMFSQFGSKATIATKESVLKIQLIKKVT